ncbi:hypothetical protein [Nostoc sp. CMAA1605]|uniref:hypothetical protein n=1 Tax=Nostoc sp. CMAA1605 TaxID=2055159 RepID=UPI001F3563E1|nr:hypothetical protein [Nostoc sp. CMAA1605]
MMLNHLICATYSAKKISVNYLQSSRLNVQVALAVGANSVCYVLNHAKNCLVLPSSLGQWHQSNIETGIWRFSRWHNLFVVVKQIDVL